MDELIFFALKFAASLVFLTAVMIVVGAISALLESCLFFPPAVIAIIKASVLCVSVAAEYRLFFA